MTRARTNVVYSIDLARGLDVYTVDLPGAARAASASTSTGIHRAAVVPMGVAGGAVAISALLGRLRRRKKA